MSPRPGRPGPVLVAGLICAFGYLITSPVGDVGPLRGFYSGHGVRIAAIQWAGVAIAGMILFRARRPGVPVARRVLPLVAVALLCQLPGLATAPRSSSDAYRYVLDGRVQLAGISPYRYVPLDDHLARFRDPILFPGLTPEQPSGVSTPAKVRSDPAAVSRLAASDPRTRINRPRVPTIYPPVAEAWFAAVAAVTPWRAGTFGLQLGSALLALLLTGVIGVALRRRGRDPVWAAVWGWTPLGVLETGNGAHVDVLAAGFVVGAVLVLEKPSARRRIAGGVLIGAAIATKVLPLLVLPAVTVLRRARGGGPRGLTVPFSAVGAVLLSYLPHVLVVGSLVLGYLPGYLSEEGFSDGSKRYALLAPLLPDALLRPAAMVLLVVLGLVVLLRAGPDRTVVGALWMYGGGLLVSTPEYPWYGLPLLALAALAGRPEWLALTAAMEFAYVYLNHPAPAAWAYAVAAVIVLGVTGLRWWRGGSVIPADTAPPGPSASRDRVPAAP